VEPSEPERWIDQFERSEHVPGERLLKSVTRDGAQPYGRSSDPIQVMRNDDELRSPLFWEVYS
jgi:hypothetical protein